MATSSSGSPNPSRVRTSDFKSRVLHVAQTSVYLVKLQPPPAVAAFLSGRGLNYALSGQDIELACTQTSLPGHQLNTIDVMNDYRGVSEKMAYRKQYDNLAFTFYVDHDYDVVQMFEGWIDYIAGHTLTENQYINQYASYRMNYPEGSGGYRCNSVYVTKFEKDVGARKSGSQSKLDYTFVGAYPLSINSTPVSYAQSDVLKYTVNMTYIRYVMSRKGRGGPGSASRVSPYRFQGAGASTGGTGNTGGTESGTFDTQDGRFLGPPTASPFLGNSQQSLNELYAAGRSGKIKSAGDFIGPLQ